MSPVWVRGEMTVRRASHKKTHEHISPRGLSQRGFQGKVVAYWVAYSAFSLVNYRPQRQIKKTQ